MPGKSLATSLKRERGALNDMHFRTPFARDSGLRARIQPTRTGSQELRPSAVVISPLKCSPGPSKVEHDLGELSGSAVDAVRRAGCSWHEQMDRKLSRFV
jgi:hypothetical protein